MNQVAFTELASKDAEHLSATTGPAKGGLGSPSFIGLVVTQLLTAVNDNLFRWLAVGIGKDYVDESQHSNILMAGTACFVLPYLLLAAPAGYLADRFSKRKVIIACKMAEVVIMSLGVLAIVLQSSLLLFTVVALTGAQSALFSPAKLGALPEVLKSDRISAANGLFGLMTVAATVIGMAFGSMLKDATGYRGVEHWWISAVALVAIAVAGVVMSLFVKTPGSANPKLQFPWNPFRQTCRDLALLWSHKALFRVALGMVFFWSVGALAQINIDQFAFESGAIQESHKTPLLVALVLGLGVGSIMAGVASRGRVELGLLPLGALGVAIFAALLCTVQTDIIQPSATLTFGFVWASFLLFALGTSAGLFSVPLEAFMQHRSPRRQRGAILAAANFLVFGGVFISALLYAALRAPIFSDEPFVSSRTVFLLTGLFTVPVLLYIVCLIPQASIRFLVWLASLTIYRIRVYGRDNLPEEGGALLAPNHVSWLDGILLLMTSSRPVRMVVWAGNFTNPWLRWLANQWGAILITPRPKAIVAALKTATEALNNGEIVCIFPEGGITRSGQLQSFKQGIMRVLKGTDAPVVPVYLDELWGSIFSFEGGKFFTKWPKRWPYPISIHFGEPIAKPNDVHEIRQAVLELGAKAVKQRMERTMLLSRSLIRRCKESKRQMKIADSSGAALTGGQLLTRSLVLRRALRREVLDPKEQYVGVLLPPSNGAVIVNACLSLDRRIAVNLNYTVSSDVMNACIRQAGIKHVLTSAKFMEKMDFDLDAEVVLLEDFKDKVTSFDKASGFVDAYLTPASMLDRKLGLGQVNADDVLTVIFTSGSTGTPKGVMLTYGNVGSNSQAIQTVIHLTGDDVLIGILPFFHSFGYTVAMWTVLATETKGVYHFNPLDSRQVSKLCGRHKGTILLATPTFLRSYMRRCEPSDLETLDVVVAGAEKLPQAVSDAFEERMGVRPVEGYGTTELSPLVSVNIPPSRARTIDDDVTLKEGSVGRPAPGITAKIVDLDSGEERGVGETGMLLIKGPNVMKGYMGRDDLTAEVIKDGWYTTGDVAYIDEDGFIFITGRESRFSKIGGEMVPHIKVEEVINEILSDDENESDDESQGLKAAVTSLSDEKKGEKLVVLHLPISMSIDELRKKMSEAGLPNIYIPAQANFVEVEALPILGSGKLDLKAVLIMAEERA